MSKFNSKPLDTPVEDFTEAELDAMEMDEHLARAFHVSGSVDAVIVQIAERALGDVLATIKAGKLLNGVMGDSDESAEVIARAMEERMVSLLMATVDAGRDVQRMSEQYPEIPEKAPQPVAAN
jgi:hypothetical protein